MSNMKEVGRIRGGHHTYVIKQDTGISSTKYYVVRDDGKSWGSFSSLEAAFRAAREKAGPDSYESR